MVVPLANNVLAVVMAVLRGVHDQPRMSLADEQTAICVHEFLETPFAIRPLDTNCTWLFSMLGHRIIRRCGVKPRLIAGYQRKRGTSTVWSR